MKKFYFILLMLCTLCISQSKAQQTVDSGTGRAQNVFVEVGGQGLFFTANYDTRFSNKRNGIGGRAGIGYLTEEGSPITTVPVGLNYLLGKGKNFFEVGLGVTFINIGRSDNDFFFPNNSDGSTGSGSTVLGTMSFSYRLQPVDSGFSLRVGLTPFFNRQNFIPYYAGFSLGYTFSGKAK